MKNLANLADEAIELFPLSEADASGSYAGWLMDAEVTRYTEIMPRKYEIAELQAYIRSNIDDPNSALWGIRAEIDSAKRHIGNIRLSGINRRHRRGVIAILIGERAAWGRGIGERAISLCATFAFNVLDLRKLTAGIVSGHSASRRTFEKAGFHLEATLERHDIFEEREIDVWQLARFRGR